MVDLILEYLAPIFMYLLAAALAVGIVIAIGIGRLRSRLGLVERQRFLLVETGFYVVFLVGALVLGAVIIST